MILDAGGILALTRGSADARATLERAVREGYVAVIPTPVLAQVHRGGRDRAHVDRVVNMVDGGSQSTSQHGRCFEECSHPVGRTVPGQDLPRTPVQFGLH